MAEVLDEVHDLSEGLSNHQQGLYRDHLCLFIFGAPVDLDFEEACLWKNREDNERLATVSGANSGGNWINAQWYVKTCG